MDEDRGVGGGGVVVSRDECMAVAVSEALSARVMDVTDGGAATAAMAMREDDDED